MQEPVAAAAALVQERERPGPLVRPRAYALALLLCPLNAFWVLTMQVAWNLGYPSMLSLFFNVVLVLFLLLLVNRVLDRVAPRQALTQAELLTLYIALAMSTAVTQFCEYLVPLLAGPFHLASPEADWLAQLNAPLARLLTVREPDAVRDLTVGDSSILAHLAVWAVPFLGWTLFVSVLLFTTLCVGTLFYRQWADAERLPFPIVQIPVQMTAVGGYAAFRSKLFWLGFALAGGLTCWNGVATLFPSLPMLPIKRQVYLDYSHASVPMNAFGIVYGSLHPFAVGLGYFLPLDLTFSLGACYWLQQFLRYGAASIGFAADNPRFPYVDYQAFGAWIALCGFALWSARLHLRAAFRQAWTGSEADSKGPLPLSYRTAFLGVLGGFVFLSVFAVYLGLPKWAAVVFFAFYFAIVTAMARARAELGPPAVDLFFTAPGKVMVAAFGGKLLGAQALVSLSLFYWMTIEYPWHPIGHQIEALRIGDQQRFDPRRIALGVLGIALLAWTCAFLIVLHLDYTLGAATSRQLGGTQVWYVRDSYSASKSWFTEMTPPDRGGILAMSAGGLVTALLTFARLRIIGWPLHPVGYALMGSYTTNYLWLPLWISCAIKAVIVRYGGLRYYRLGMPFFLGLLLGEFVVGGGWALLSVLTGQKLYVFWPY
jgi:hypothetical protein